MDPGAKHYFGEWQTFGRSNFRVGATISKNPRFGGQSALLIDQHTRSAAEIMAPDHKRGLFGSIVGTPSAEVEVSRSLFVMPRDLLLYVAVSGMTFHSLCRRYQSGARCRR
jgi:C-terminal processing protease CtpA/Prc